MGGTPSPVGDTAGSYCIKLLFGLGSRCLRGQVKSGAPHNYQQLRTRRIVSHLGQHESLVCSFARAILQTRFARQY